ncbi:MAG: DNA-binding protein [Ruminiclostridium sp.]|nr:DNA-binding protein [Ruminiclostridium sp.]
MAQRNNRLIDGKIAKKNRKGKRNTVSVNISETVTAQAEQKVSVPDGTMEMLTIKECTELVKGLTSNTIRNMIARGELECVRAGCGTNGKILIQKANIISLCSMQQKG